MPFRVLIIIEERAGRKSDDFAGSNGPAGPESRGERVIGVISSADFDRPRCWYSEAASTTMDAYGIIDGLHDAPALRLSLGATRL